MTRHEIIDDLINIINDEIPYYDETEFHNLSDGEKNLYHMEVEEAVTEILNGLLQLEKM